MAARAPQINTRSRRIESAVHRCAAGRSVVLAISGGRDSMALLHAASRAIPRSAITVATFDHGTGPAATRAADHVADEAARLGLPVVIGRAGSTGRSEAAWREARHAFLRDLAKQTGAPVMTGHTRDDQVETVFMRVLRGTGTRGLAGLYAGGEMVRPLLEFSRDEVADYARSVGATWVEDPTNASVAFFRNRVRRDLLPALTRVDPALDRALLDAARRAASWRESVDAWVAKVAHRSPDGRRVSVTAANLAPHSGEELAVLWPALAATVGVAMDRRGTQRAAAFTRESRVGARMQLSGGWEIVRSRDAFEMVPVLATLPPAREPLTPGLRWHRWRFDSTGERGAPADEWSAMLPADAPSSVRSWQPGDRMRLGAGRTRKVKRLLSDARVSGAQRELWPVVLAGEEIVWIPGVRRSDAAAERPGRPGVLYRCELDDR